MFTRPDSHVEVIAGKQLQINALLLHKRLDLVLGHRKELRLRGLLRHARVVHEELLPGDPPLLPLLLLLALLPQRLEDPLALLLLPLPPLLKALLRGADKRALALLLLALFPGDLLLAPPVGLLLEGRNQEVLCLVDLRVRRRRRPSRRGTSSRGSPR